MTTESVHQSARTIPKVPGAPVIGNLREFQRNPLDFNLDITRKFGDLAIVTVLGEQSIVVSDPDAVQYILQTNSRNYNKQTRDYQLLYPLVGHGLLTSDGEHWLRQRRLMQPAFHRQRIAGFGAMMAREAENVMDRWRVAAATGSAVAVDQEMMRLTLTIVGRALLSIDLGEEANEFGRAFKTANARFGYDNMVSMMFPWLPTGPNRAFKSAIRTMDAIVYGIIRERRAHPTGQDDLLTLLLEAKDEEAPAGESAGMTDQQLRDELMTVLLAGHETTANALTWAFYLLSQHPQVAGKLQEEVDAVLVGRPPTIDDLPDLSYTRMVFQETLRMYPPAWGIARRAIEDDYVAGYHIPAGSLIYINIHTLHHHPRLWDQPERFVPERFAEEHSRHRHKFAYIPFSSGPRKCIGDQFATMEGQIILATVAQHYHLELAPGHPVDVAPLITLNPRHGMQMIPRPRGALRQEVNHG